MTMSDVAWKLLESLTPVMLASVTWLSVKAAALINAKVKNEYLKSALTRLDDVVISAVMELQQTMVREIKEAKADGKLTDEEKAHIKQVALDTIKAHLGEKGLDELKTVLGFDDLDRWLTTKIEASVLKIHQ